MQRTERQTRICPGQGNGFPTRTLAARRQFINRAYGHYLAASYVVSTRPSARSKVVTPLLPDCLVVGKQLARILRSEAAEVLAIGGVATHSASSTAA